MSSSAERTRFLIALLVASLGACALHVVAGWPFTVAGAAVGAWISPRFGWLAGLVAGIFSWTALALWSRWVDPAAVYEMLRVVGSLFSGAGATTAFLATVTIGGLLGLAGGLVGQSARNLFHPVGR